jgi:hypothetical protein
LQDAQSDIDSVIKILDLVIAVGRYILPVTVAVALLTAAAALNSIATSNIAAATFWFIVASLSAILALQIALKRNLRSRHTRAIRAGHPSSRVAQA